MKAFGENLLNNKRIFITGTDTDIGKTVVASIFVKALGADYWKPVQCGSLEASDSQCVQELVNEDRRCYHPERYRLAAPKSPHKAAAEEGLAISLRDFVLPQTSRPLVVEGAGGPLAPLNAKDWVIDLPACLGLATVVVTEPYLGSLNHTFLAIEAIRQRGLGILGLVVNGKDDDFTSFVRERSGLPVLLQLNKEAVLTPELVELYARNLTL